MPNVVFPNKVKPYDRLQKIAQIHYTLKRGATFLKVYKRNAYEAHSTWSRYGHTAPLHIEYPLSTIIWRMRCLSDLFDSRRDAKTTIRPILKRYMEYLDDTLDYVWGECLAHGTPYEDNWWPPSLLRWSAIEFSVGRHTSCFVDEWQATRQRAVPHFSPPQLEGLKKKMAVTHPCFGGPFKKKLKWEELSVAEQRRMRTEVSKWLAIEEGMSSSST